MSCDCCYHRDMKPYNRSGENWKTPETSPLPQQAYSIAGPGFPPLYNPYYNPYGAPNPPQYDSPFYPDPCLDHYSNHQHDINPPERYQENGILDSGVRRDFGTGSVRDTEEGKGRYDLIPTYAMKRLAQWYEKGATKYGDRNWEKGQPLSRYYSSARRHLDKAFDGHSDEDHEAAAIWNMVAFLWTKHMIDRNILPIQLDDRPTYDGVLVGEMWEDTNTGYGDDA